MQRIDAVVIGGGQAGLAVSRCLAARGIEHVVLERGRIAESWRSERWDSLRLLTPNWQTRLPGFSYRGPDPDGFMTAGDTADFLADYAGSFGAPVEAGAAVLRLERDGGGYRVATGRGSWLARAVVVATGHCQAPRIPAAAGGLPPAIRQLSSMHYRRPEALPPGGVLVVGASSSGVQIADEIRLSGRTVFLSVGRHTRLPRHHRGRDILWWLDRAGMLAERIEEVADIEAARRQPSLQLAGRSDGRPLDLATLAAGGVRLLGRLRDVDGTRARFARDLAATVAAADRKLERLLARIEALAAARPGLAAGDAEPIAAVPVPPPCERLDLAAAGIRTVVWATGYVRRYPWLAVPVLDADGEIRHDGGVTPAAGLYVVGLRFLRRRNSSFIDGVGDDARFIAGRLAADLGAAGRRAA